MAERLPGTPKTTRLESRRTGGTAEPEDPSASASSMEMVLSQDVGKTIAGRYEITGVIGEGGMGVVYEAFDTQVERKVAIKLVRSDTTDRKFLSRFRRELEITSKLRHPSTIRLFEHGETADGRPYMVMELLTGESLADRLEYGPLEEMEALQIARQVAESLSEAHEHGVFHRDLKPDNIFIETVGVSKVVKVLDFGIAGGIDATRLTQAGEVFGTPQYMSPEQCNGLPLDHRTDIYSLACILYEMIEGRPPFSAETPMATMLKHVRAKVPSLRNAAKETSRVVLMGLRKDRGKRIQTAGRFSELIGEAMGHLRANLEGRVPTSDSGRSAAVPIAAGSTTPTTGVITVPAPIPGLGDEAERRGKTIAMLLAAAALSLVAIMVFGDVGSNPAEDPEPTSKEAVMGGENEASSPDGAPANAQVPYNRALVRSNVEAAEVLVDGEMQCETPCEIKVPVGDGRSHEIRLQKEGYRDVVQNWRPRHVEEALPPLPDLEPL